jgi:hypothetical protein
MMTEKNKFALDLFAGKIETGMNGFVDYDSIFGAVREFNEETDYKVYLYLSGKKIEDYNQDALGTLSLIADSQEYFESIIRKNTKLLRAEQRDHRFNRCRQSLENLLISFGCYIIDDAYIPLEIFTGVLDIGTQYNVIWVPIKELWKYNIHPRLNMINFTKKINELY